MTMGGRHRRKEWPNQSEWETRLNGSWIAYTWFTFVWLMLVAAALHFFLS